MNTLNTTRQSDIVIPEEMRRTQIRNSLLSTGVQVCWDQPGFPILRQHWSVAFVAGVAEQFVSALCPSACLQILPQWEKSNPANSNSNNYTLVIPAVAKTVHWDPDTGSVVLPSPHMHTYIYSQRYKISFASNSVPVFGGFSADKVSISSSTNRSRTNTKVQ